MLLRLLALFFCVSSAVAASAQCPSSSSSSDSDSGSSGSSDSGGSGYYGSSEWGENDSRFRLGYGQRYLLHNYSTVLSDDSRNPIDNRWLGSRPAHVFDLSWGIGAKDNWRLGTAFSTQRLQSETQKFHFDPPNYDPASAPDSIRPFDMSFDKTARLYNQTVYAEYSFLKLANNRLRLFARGDIGATYYGARAAINYSDTCGCDQQPLVENTGSMVMTGAASLGLQFEYRAFGIKALAGYQWQTVNSFITRGQLAEWTAGFRAEDYNFSGAPEHGRFSIDHTDYEHIKSRNNQLFLQVSLYVFFGRSY